MRRTFYCLALTLTIMVLIPHFTLFVSYSYATTYYVSATGSNNNSGTYEHPWATPGYGSRQLHPGDTLIILSGRYILRQDDDIINPTSGAFNAWITIRGENGNRPVLVGRDNLLTAINISGVQYIRIENLEITHDETATGEALWFREGVEILGTPAAHIVLEDLYIHHIDEFGMDIQDVDDLQILNCRIEYCGFGALGGPAGEYGGWRNVTIRGCSLSWSGHYYQGTDGSNRPYDRPDGFGIEPSKGPVIIENTLAEHNYGDGLDSKAENTTIQSCIIANNSCDGVKLWANNSRIENTLIYGRGDANPEVTPWAPIVIDQVEQPNARFEIVNVTVDDSLGHNYLLYVQYLNPVPVQIILRNSIFCGRGHESPIYVYPASTLIADHNLFYLPQSEIILTYGDTVYTHANIASFGEGNIYGNPNFIRPAWGHNGDYHLQEGSPAINAGTANGAPSEDLEGRLRINPPDIGCYEFQSAVHVKEYHNRQSHLLLLQNYPNPFNSETVIHFRLPAKQHVRMEIFNPLGQTIALITDDEFSEGDHYITFSPPVNLSSGVYFCRLSTINFTKTKKLLLMR